MYRDIGFTTSAQRLFKSSSASVPIGRPKKATGRFRIQKRQREGEPTDVLLPTLFSAESMAHEALILGLREKAEPSVMVSNGSASMPLAAYSLALIERYTSIKIEGADGQSITTFFQKQLEQAKHQTSVEMSRSRQSLRLRHEAEIVVGEALGLEPKSAANDRFEDAPEVQGIVPTLVFESLSLRKGTIAEEDPLLPLVSSTSYPSQNFEVANLKDIMAAAFQSSGTGFHTKVYSRSLQQRLYKSVHDVFKSGKANTVSERLRQYALQADSDVRAAAMRASTYLSALICQIAQEVTSEGAGQLPVADNSSHVLQVDIDSVNEEVTFDLGMRRHRITLTHYRRLRALFSHTYSLYGFGSTLAVPKKAVTLAEKVFHHRLFTVLERYFALSGCHPQLSNEGGWHAAVPTAAMQSLAAEQGVAFEAFASPLNSSSLFYGSAFADSDCHFGSVGSFFSLTLCSGAIEVNPPFDPTVAVQTVEHIHSLLTNNMGGPERHLTFTVTIPTTDSTKSVSKGGDEGQKQLQSASDFVSAVEGSPFLLAMVLLAGSDSPYRDGNEFISEGTHFLTRMGTLVATLGSPVTAEQKTHQEKALRATALAWKAVNQ